MKKLSLVLFVLFAITISSNAQIPNGGFETWENYYDDGGECMPPYNTYEKPDFWVGSLPYSCETNSFSLEKNNESYPEGTGQFSLKIQPDIPNGVRGVVISNDSADPMTNWIPQPSFAINYRPESLYLYYKCFPYGGDTIIANIYFYKDGVVIGNPYIGTTQTVSEWTPLEIPMTYYNSEVPDSATILFVTGAYVQHSESTMYIDNLSFNGFVTDIPDKISLNSNVNIYPNPATDYITVSTENLNNTDLTVNIYNVIGALVKSETLLQDQEQLNIEDLESGIYMLEIKSKEWSEKQKLIIKR
ncbi:MAG: T9SS type A sorting domain-containing protein [Bacteroidales bacterium]|nr:T9SS type A sorting domain-containing protein [Bacteroidales bacterium]